MMMGRVNWAREVGLIFNGQVRWFRCEYRFEATPECYSLILNPDVYPTAAGLIEVKVSRVKMKACKPVVITLHRGQAGEKWSSPPFN